MSLSRMTKNWEAHGHKRGRAAATTQHSNHYQYNKCKALQVTSLPVRCRNKSHGLLLLLLLPSLAVSHKKKDGAVDVSINWLYALALFSRLSLTTTASAAAANTFTAVVEQQRASSTSPLFTLSYFWWSWHGYQHRSYQYHSFYPNFSLLPATRN